MSCFKGLLVERETERKRTLLEIDSVRLKIVESYGPVELRKRERERGGLTTKITTLLETDIICSPYINMSIICTIIVYDDLNLNSVYGLSKTDTYTVYSLGTDFQNNCGFAQRFKMRNYLLVMNDRSIDRHVQYIFLNDNNNLPSLQRPSVKIRVNKRCRVRRLP